MQGLAAVSGVLDDDTDPSAIGGEGGVGAEDAARLNGYGSSATGEDASADEGEGGDAEEAGHSFPSHWTQPNDGLT